MADLFKRPDRAAFSKEAPPVAVRPKRTAAENYRHALETGKVKPKPSRKLIAVGNRFYA